LLHAAPTLYEARGDFQLIVRHLEPVGVGNLQAAFEQLKTKLRDKGLFYFSKWIAFIEYFNDISNHRAI
jgi:exonuclease VII large subunit